MTENSISPDERRRTRSMIAPPAGVYFTALSRMLARAWARNSRLPRTLQAGSQLGLEVEALVLAEGLVELGDVGGQFGRIEQHLVGRVAGRLQPRDGQHGGEGAQHPVGVLQRLGQRRVGIALAGVDVDQATSSRARRRVSGERRSWAMASPAWRRPAMERSSRSSMSLRPAASSSNSSRVPRTCARARQVAAAHGVDHLGQAGHAAA